MVLCIFAALLSPVLLYMSLIVFPNPGWGEFFYDSSDGNIYSTARVSREYAYTTFHDQHLLEIWNFITQQ